MNYSWEEIESEVLAWNQKNYEPLREGYVRAQLSWYKRQGDSKLPPNCANDAYYAAIGVVCSPNAHCLRFKNPVNYALSKMRQPQETKKRKKK